MPDVVNLCFHGVGVPQRELEPGEEDYWISRDLFLRILDVVRERGRVSLSFDDGNASDAEIAAPALEERGLDAEFFVLSGRMDEAGSLSRDAVRELHRRGFAIGSHGMEHRSWRHLDPAEATAELVRARMLLMDVIGTPVATAALPFGDYDGGTLRELRRLGYARVYSSDRARPRSGTWFQPRYTVRACDDLASVRRLLHERPGRVQASLDRARIAAKSVRR